MCVYVCVKGQAQVLFFRLHPPFIFGDRPSQWPETFQVGLSVSLSGLPVSSSPDLGLQQWTTMFGILVWVWGIELRCTFLPGKCFTEWAILPVTKPLFLLIVVLYSLSGFVHRKILNLGLQGYQVCQNWGCNSYSILASGSLVGKYLLFIGLLCDIWGDTGWGNILYKVYCVDQTIVKSCWDSSVDTVLIVEACRLVLGSFAPCKNQAWSCMSVISALTRGRKAKLVFYLASVDELVSSSVWVCFPLLW